MHLRSAWPGQPPDHAFQVHRVSPRIESGTAAAAANDPAIGLRTCEPLLWLSVRRERGPSRTRGSDHGCRLGGRSLRPDLSLPPLRGRPLGRPVGAAHHLGAGAAPPSTPWRSPSIAPPGRSSARSAWPAARASTSSPSISARSSSSASATPSSRRVVRIAKSQNITSIADFVAARYGKSERVAALVSVIAVIGTRSLHRPPAQGRVGLARRLPVGRRTSLDRAVRAGPRRPRARRRLRARRLRDRVRNASRGRDRAPGRPDARDLARSRWSSSSPFLIVGIYVTFVMFGGSSGHRERLAARDLDSATSCARTSDPAAS